MGKGSRHGRNQNCSAVFSYHEREKYKKQSGYGSINERLTADTIKDWDACSLSLQTCKEPMCTSDGHVYDKEAILEYIVNRKKYLKKQMKLYEGQKEQVREALMTTFIIGHAQDEVEKEREEQRKLEAAAEKFAAVESTPARIGGQQ